MVRSDRHSAEDGVLMVRSDRHFAEDRVLMVRSDRHSEEDRVLMVSLTDTLWRTGRRNSETKKLGHVLITQTNLETILPRK